MLEDRQCWRLASMSICRGGSWWLGFVIRTYTEMWFDTAKIGSVLRFIYFIHCSRIPVIKPRCLPSMSALSSNSSRNPSSP